MNYRATKTLRRKSKVSQAKKKKKVKKEKGKKGKNKAALIEPLAGHARAALVFGPSPLAAGPEKGVFTGLM